MAIKPFRAWRPSKDKVHLVASRSYVSYTPAQLRRKLDENPYTFLHIIHPDGTAKLLRSELDTRFRKVRQKFKAFCAEGILKREAKPALYVYEQVMQDHSCIGVIAGVPVTDYHEARIKKHEQTLTKRESLFARYLRITGINAEPVLLSTKRSGLSKTLRRSIRSKPPLYDYTTTNKHRHKLWCLEDQESIARIVKEIGDRELYIADGHHRSASSALLSGGGENKPSDHFMAMGYENRGEYDFVAEKLRAYHFEHADDANLPKIFISELLTEQFSDELQDIIQGLDEQVSEDEVRSRDFLYSGRPWRLDFAQYIQLLQESEYAAWTAAFGYRANHFTVSINHLTTFFDIQTLNQFIIDHGFAMNESGGLIKGTPAQLLEQSSTMAPMVNLEFSDVNHLIPSCFYEFAKRYPTETGRLYQGFIAASADKIFESTDTK